MLRLRTKFTLVMTSLALFVIAVLSYAFGAQLLEQPIHETDVRARDLSEQVFLQAKYALVEAAQQGLHPDSDAPKEVHDYVRHAFEISEGLRTQLAAAHQNLLIYEVSITDTDGMVLASTDKNLPGTFLPRRVSLCARPSKLPAPDESSLGTGETAIVRGRIPLYPRKQAVR